LQDVLHWIFKKMKTFYIHICVLLTIHIQCQSAFTRVRADLTSKNNKFILDSCLAANYHKDSVLYYKGIIALKLNNINEAKAGCKELMKAYPDFSEAHYLNGLIYLSGKNYGKSVNEFTMLLQKNPKHLKALYNRALALGLMGEYDKAIEDLTACIALKPFYPLAYYSRAYWQEYLGNYPAAIKDYETTINLDPKNYDAYFGLAYIYHGLKSNSKSCEVINSAIQAGSQIAEDIKDNFCR
jgi:tetratricopeptide (TPR) repeat protein